MPYKIATEEDKKRLGIYEEYDAIVDEDDNTHVLTEPEDRTWFRDLNPVMEELNTSSAKLDEMRALVGEMESVMRNVVERLTELSYRADEQFWYEDWVLLQETLPELLLKAEALK